MWRSWRASKRGYIRPVTDVKNAPLQVIKFGMRLSAPRFARVGGKDARIIAIEPGLETCSRLEANIAASEADVQIICAAISDAPGTGFLSTDEANRGEAKLVSGGQDIEAVVIDTLARICRAHGVTHIDAMKLDIEGHDLPALSGFFEDAPTRLHPDLLILETGRAGVSPLIELCVKQGYVVQSRAGLNSILVKKTDVKT
jgi:FkbM family methyltransferase